MPSLNISQLTEEQKYILRRFKENILGKIPDCSSDNPNHDGKIGHWLEERFDIQANSKTQADIMGYELKKYSSRITFGDWSADKYIFKGPNAQITRDEFMEIFGNFNKEKNRYSWSGECCPKVEGYNRFGQKLVVTEDRIEARFSFSEYKNSNSIPTQFQVDDLVLASWGFSKLEKNIKQKFGQKGFLICRQNQKKEFESISFGKKILFNEWIESVQLGEIFFDSGMYAGNVRPYSQWRANSPYWNKLIECTFSYEELKKLFP